MSRSPVGRRVDRAAPVDHAVRTEAREAIDRSLLVEAGAGTGKTTLLVGRVLHLIARGRIDADGIVAITFAEKAAAELRARLREALERAAAGETDTAGGATIEWSAEERARFTDALASLSLANITTIHAFAGSLLRERPVEAGVDPGFTQLDALAADALLAEVWTRWETAELSKEAEPYRRVLAAGVGRERVRKLGRDLVTHRALSSAGALDAGAPLDLAALAGALARGVAALEALVARDCKKPDDTFVKILGDVAARVRVFAAADPEEREALFGTLDFPKSAKKGNKLNWRSRESLDRAREGLDALRALAGEAAACATAELARWLGGFLDAYAAAKALRGALDFDDLLICARDLLRDRPDVRGDFLSAFGALVIDEFQDTDPLQTEILVLLSEKTAAAARWEDVSVAPGKLFVVGDPKQSIYRFRRADIDVYATVRDRLFPDAMIRITQNFRSVPGLVDWTNSLFARLFADEDGSRSQAEFAPIAAQRPASGGEPPILLLAPPPEAEATLTADGAREAEAEAIAEAIASGIAEGWARPSDVAILFRTIKSITPYEDALEARGIPFQVEGGKAYYEREEVQALLACLVSVDDPEDPVSLVAALRSSHFGISDDSLAILVADGRPFRYLDDSGGEHAEIADAFATLRALHARRADMALHRLVEAVLEETRALEFHALRGGGRRPVANLRRVAEKARAFESLGPATLRGFVRWLAEEAGEGAEGDSPIADARDELVTLTTIHKAKGLEWPVVALANLHGGGGFRDTFLVEGLAGRFAFSLGGKESFWKSPGFEEMRVREEERQRAEERRILYVATTRARDRLILAAHPALLKRKDKGLFADLASGLPPREDWRDGAIVGGIRVRVALQEEARDRMAPAASGASGAPAARAARGGRLRAGGAAAGALDEPAWIAARGATIARGRAPLEIVTSRRLRAPQIHVPAPSADDEAAIDNSVGAATIALGGFVHRVLEAIPEFDTASLEKTAADVAARDGFEGDRGGAVALVRAILGQPVIARARSAASAHREVPFSSRLDAVAGAGASPRLAEGIVDLLFEEDGEIVIVDYKSDRIGGAPPHDRARLEAHAAARGQIDQMALYAQAVRAATGRPIREAVLVYGRAGAELALPGARLLAHALPEPFPVVTDDDEAAAGAP